MLVRIGDYSTALALKKQYGHIFLLVVDMEEQDTGWNVDDDFQECKKIADYTISRDSLNQNNRISEDKLKELLNEIEAKAKRVVCLTDEKETTELIIYEKKIYHVATYILEKQAEKIPNIKMCSRMYERNMMKIQRKIENLFDKRTVEYMYLYIKYLEENISKEEVKKELPYAVSFADVEKILNCAESLSYDIVYDSTRRKLREFLD